jgi:Bacterial SH3 domain
MKALTLLLLLTLTGHAQTNKPVFNEDQSQMLLNQKVVLDNNKDGFMGLKKVIYAPSGKRFLVLACGFECSDNIGFLFNADGTGKRRFTQAWDLIFEEGVEWSADSQYVYYYRINSTAAEPPRNAPKEGWVQVNFKTGAKTPAKARRLKPDATYALFRVRMDDTLNIRRAPGSKTKIVGTIPFDGKGIEFLSETKQIGPEVWAKIQFGKISGWVNQSYLYEEAK